MGDLSVIGQHRGTSKKQSTQSAQERDCSDDTFLFAAERKFKYYPYMQHRFISYMPYICYSQGDQGAQITKHPGW